MSSDLISILALNKEKTDGTESTPKEERLQKRLQTPMENNLTTHTHAANQDLNIVDVMGGVDQHLKQEIQMDEALILNHRPLHQL